MKACSEAVLSKMAAGRGLSSGPAVGRTPSMRGALFQTRQLELLFFGSVRQEAP